MIPRLSLNARYAATLITALVFGLNVLTGTACVAATPNSDSLRLSKLSQNRVAWATPANDLGAVADDMPLSHMTVVLRRAQQQQAFKEFLKQQQDPNSPNFHHWLSPSQVGEKFGASRQDINAVTRWLQSQHLHVDAVSNSRMRIDFSGLAANVGAAFNSPVHAYLVNGQRRIATAGDPMIPASLSTVVQSVHGLATINERPDQGAGTAQSFDQPGLAANPGGSFCSGSACTHYLFPGDFARIYDINPVYQQGIDGSGQTIAIIGRAKVYLPDIENFQARSGLPIKDPVIVVPPNGVNPGPAKSSGGNPTEDQLEATIDVSRATSVAPGATIDLVVSGNTASLNGLAIASEYVVDTSPVMAQVMSISFGACEAQAGQSGVDFYDSIFSQAVAEGISVFVISGDSGAAGCDPYLATPPANQPASSNYICVSSYATCVGGTQFADTENPDAYWDTSNTNGFESAFGYIPEGAWNEPLDYQGKPQAAASGGGVSKYVATPYWQTGVGVPGTQGRYTPDVSFSASGHDGYFACLAAAGNSCVPDSSGHFQFEYFYGTSATTPDMAGVAALLNQKMAGAQGNLNPRLYALAAAPGNGVFHDVTVSTSGVLDCEVSIPSMCNNSTPGPNGLSGGLEGYLVGSGYDLATGLGSIDVANLLAHWSDSGTTTPAVNLDQHGLTGSWYNPATGGQGFEMEVYPDLIGPGQGQLFAGWFTFDTTPTGGKRWYVLSGNVSNTSASAQLQIGVVQGGNFDAPPALSGSVVGDATLQFTDCDTASLSYQFSDGSGRSGTIPLTRLTTNITCGASGDNGAAPTDYLLSGNWYDPNTGGQGLIFDVNPAQSLIFATWYTFLPNGQQTGGAASQSWYTIPTGVGPFTDGLTSLNDIPIGETTGGIFDNPANATTVQVGSVNIAFHSCTAMTMAYTFTSGTNKGKTGTINLVRAGPAPQGCSL